MERIDRAAMGRDIESFRRLMWRQMLVSAFRGRRDFEIGSIQLISLFVLEEREHLTIKELAGILGRSLSATSRIVEDMVGRRWLRRREDEDDRRSKRVSLAPAGRALLGSIEKIRVQAQLELIDELSRPEQAVVAEAMRLLAAAAEKKSNASRTA